MRLYKYKFGISGGNPGFNACAVVTAGTLPAATKIAQDAIDKQNLDRAAKNYPPVTLDPGPAVEPFSGIGLVYLYDGEA